MVFAEYSWTPGDMVQAEDRAHRIGQRQSVNVQYLHVKKSIDDVMWKTLATKLDNVGQVLSASLQKECESIIAADASHRSALLCPCSLQAVVDPASAWPSPRGCLCNADTVGNAIRCWMGREMRSTLRRRRPLRRHSQLTRVAWMHFWWHPVPQQQLKGMRVLVVMLSMQGSAVRRPP